MKLTKENICVFIEDEAQLEQARELLVKYGYQLLVMYPIKFCYLWFREEENYWVNTLLKKEEIEITLTELEKILSDGK